MNTLEQYTQDCIDISELDLTEEEERAIEALCARIRVTDESWGDSLNDEQAILRVVLAARRAARNV